LQNHQEHIQIFRSLFKGREDVFAVRWEKGSKSGYMPAYFYDHHRLRAHKMNSGTFQNLELSGVNFNRAFLVKEQIYKILAVYF
jgi:hypothetical protein